MGSLECHLTLALRLLPIDNKTKNTMDLENITLTNDRPGMTVEPDINDVTGEATGQNVFFSSGKDQYAFNSESFTEEELIDALSPEQFQEHQDNQFPEEVLGDEEVNLLLTEPDEPSQEMAQAVFNADLPDDYAHDVVQVLATKYYLGELTVDQAVAEAKATGEPIENLRKAFSNLHYYLNK